MADLKDLVIKHPVIFFLSTLLLGFTTGFGAYDTIIKTSGQKVISSNEYAEWHPCPSKLEKALDENKKLKNEKIKIHLLDEKGDKTPIKKRALQISEDIGKATPFEVDEKITSGRIPEDIEIEDEVKMVILHQNAFVDQDGSLTLRALKRYHEKNSKTKFIIYSASFYEGQKEPYLSRLKNEANIILEPENLIYYPYNGKLEQESARLKILKHVLKLL